ncbi:hypothetical protein [Paractinoplanes globisporus]|uniref:Uncharacterized protein n=1 Tax=Paractinoplanes globisporus TaxID=113565 RepID=A0ABW6W5V1_9ACTN|nr:hypothetical protein [Actinoplanes globisporus]
MSRPFGEIVADHFRCRVRGVRSEKEGWRDSRSAELGAHVEIRGRKRFRLPAGRGARRVSSLSNGLRDTVDEITLLPEERE